MFLYWFWWVLAGGAEGEGDFGGQSFVQIGVFLLLIVFVFFFTKGIQGTNMAATQATAARKFPEGLRVIAVDDSPVCLMLLEALLRRCKYQREFLAC